MSSVQTFAVLWTLGFLFHYDGPPPADALALSMASLALAYLFRPQSVGLFCLFLLGATGAAFSELPAAANHTILGLLVNAAILAALVGGCGSRSLGGETQWLVWADLESAERPILSTLVIVYIAAAFHKLNSSFVDPSVSCATVLLEQGLRLNGLSPSAFAGMAGILPWLTVGVEGLIGLLLISKRSRRAGALVGVVFHVALGFMHFYDFATFVFAIYVLTLPRRDGGWFRRIPLREVSAIGLILFFSVSVADWLQTSSVSSLGARWFTLKATAWCVAVLPLVAPYVIGTLVSHADPFNHSRRPHQRWLLVIPVLALLNGMTPYLGVKTVANYSMFSNLKTEEGVTNHFIQAMSGFQLSDALTDVIEVRDVRFPNAQVRQLSDWNRYRLSRQARWLAEQPARIPALELRRVAERWRQMGLGPVSLVYKRDGREKIVPDVAHDSDVGRPLPWWLRRLIAFRAVESGSTPVRCRW